MPKSFPQHLARVVRDVLHDMVTLLADPAAGKLLLEDAGLNADAAPSSLMGADALARMDEYFQASDPSAGQYLSAINDALTVSEQIHSLIQGLLASSGTGKTARELLHAISESVALEAIRNRYPEIYYVGQLAGLVSHGIQEYRAAERVRRENVDHLTRNGGTGYYGFFLPSFDQRSADWIIGSIAVLANVIGDQYLKSEAQIDALYGWDTLPAEPLFGAERVLERTATVSVRAIEVEEDPDPPSAPPSSDAGLDVVFDVTAVADSVSKRGDGVVLAVRGRNRLEIFFRRKEDGRPRGKLTYSGPPELVIFLNKENPKLLGGGGRMIFDLDPIPDPTAGPVVVVGGAKETRLEVSRFSARAEIGGTAAPGSEGVDLGLTYGLRVKAQDAALVVVPGEGDGFLDKILRPLAPGGELRITFSLALGLERGRGIFLEGGTGLKVTVPVSKQLGPVRLDTMVLAVDAKVEDGVFHGGASFTTGLTLATTGVKMAIDQVGVEWEMRPDNRLGFKPPKGVGISISLPPVEGGGYLFFDPDNHQYAGAVHLQIGGNFLSINGVGVVSTFTDANGQKAFSFVVVLGVEFTPIQVGFGFTLNGVGGIFGLNRGINPEVLQQGLRTGALDAVLFPSNPVANAPRVVAVLSEAFPPTPGQTILGPALKLGWGTPTLIKASIGIVVEFEAPRRFMLLGKASANFPEQAPVVALEFACLGIFDPGNKSSSFDATLERSRLGPYTITGDLAWRQLGKQTEVKHGGKTEALEPFWILSVGGTHPRSPVPARRLPPLKRVGINLVQGNNPRARLEGYLAVTSNTLQVGGAIDASYSKAGFRLEGHVGIDALIRTNDWTFEFDFRVEVAIKRGSKHIASIGLEGTVTGPSPFHVDARAKIGFLFFSVTFHVSFTIGSSRSRAKLSASALEPLLAALGDVRNWSGELPELVQPLVTLRKAEPGDSPTRLVVHPLGELSVRQRVVPLGIEIQRFGSAVVSGPKRFDLVSASLGEAPVAARPIRDYFAPGEFLTLDDKARLSRPSFEQLQAGGALTGNESRLGAAREASLRYKTIVRRKARPPALGADYTPALEQFLAAVRQGSAAMSPLRRFGAGRFALPSRKLALRSPLFAIVSTLDLRPAAGEPGADAAGRSFVETVQRLGAKVGANPALRGRLQIVAAHEVRS